MDTRATLGDVHRLALADHGYSSAWTADGKSTISLDAWWDTAQLSDRPEDRLFVYDGMRIIRRGADVQDWTVVIYRADAQCGNCGVYLQEDRDQFVSRRNAASRDEAPASYCVGCLSGGAIGPHLFAR